MLPAAQLQAGSSFPPVKKEAGDSARLYQAQAAFPCVLRPDSFRHCKGHCKAQRHNRCRLLAGGAIAGAGHFLPGAVISCAGHSLGASVHSGIPTVNVLRGGVIVRT